MRWSDPVSEDTMLFGSGTQRNQAVTGPGLPPCWLGFKCWKVLCRSAWGRGAINHLSSCGTYKLHYQPVRQDVPLALKYDLWRWSTVFWLDWSLLHRPMVGRFSSWNIENWTLQSCTFQIFLDVQEALKSAVMHPTVSLGLPPFCFPVFSTHCSDWALGEMGRWLINWCSWLLSGVCGVGSS